MCLAAEYTPGRVLIAEHALTILTVLAMIGMTVKIRREDPMPST